MAVLLGRAEAARLAASPLVVLGFAVAAALIWWTNRAPVPLWWSADITIGSALLVPAGVVLLATQEAAGRPRRDGLAPLYDSYPVSPAVRTSALLLSVLGPLAMAAGVAAGAVIWLTSRGAIGTPQPAVLAGAIALVALAGAAGVALGTWVPRLAAGLLTVVVLGAIELDLVLTYDGWVRPYAGLGWLFPWYQPGSVPGALAGISLPFPWVAHAAELAALTGLAVAVALWRGVRQPGLQQPGLQQRGSQLRSSQRQGAARRGAVGVLAAVCVAAAGLSAWSQTRPVPAAEVSALVAQTVHAARFEQCEARGGVRYCFFPAFRSLVGSWAAPVSAVLARLPAPPRQPLVVRQATGNTDQLLASPPFGLVNRAPDPDAWAALRAFDDQTNGLGPPPTRTFSPSDPPVINSSQGGSADTTGLAISTAYWAVGLPTTAPTITFTYSSGSGSFPVSCEPVGQAREAIALWLAAAVVPGPAFRAELAYPEVVQVSGRWIRATYLTGSGPAMIPPATAAGLALARAMRALPARQVRAALAARWPAWLSPAATDAQLAAALGVPMPKAPAPTRLMIRNARDDVSPPSPVCP
jgi:hypothetical protein